MKILQVISTPPFAWATGGPARVVYELSKELVKRGHEVTILTTDLYKSNQRYVCHENPEYIDGIQVFRFRYISNWLAWKHKVYFAPSIIKHLRDYLCEYDIVHLQDLISVQAIATAKYCKKYGIPYVLTTHGSIPGLVEGRGLMRLFTVLFGYKILRNANKVTTVSRREVEYAKQIGVDSRRVSVIYNGMDIKSFDENIQKYGKFKKKYGIHGTVILYLGRIHRTKGLEFLIRAFSELCKEIEDITLVIAGPDDGYKVRLERIVENLNLSNKVGFTGYVDEKDKLSAYVDADIFVHTVLYMGGVGLTPLEAILYGTPVIVTEECGEVIKDANCGYLVKYDDVEELKEKMKWVIENPGEGEEMVKRGKRYIEENLTWDKIVGKIEEIYFENWDKKRMQ